MGYAYDEIEAALAGGEGNELAVPDLAARADALHEGRGEQAFLSVVLAAKRIVNITKGQPGYPLDEAALDEPAEQALAAAHAALAADIDAAVGAGDYPRALRAIATLADPLDRFFVEVMVMEEDRQCATTASLSCRRSAAPSRAWRGSPRWWWSRPSTGSFRQPRALAPLTRNPSRSATGSIAEKRSCAAALPPPPWKESTTASGRWLLAAGGTCTR